MIKHARIIVAMLLVILAGLIAAIVMFRIDINKSPSGSTDILPETAESDPYSSKAYVFMDETGLYGLRDGMGNIILEAEWTRLRETGNQFFKAELMTRSGPVYGIVSSDGDVKVPFVYEEIEKLSDSIYAGRLADEGGYMFYDAGFSLVFRDAADSYSIVDETLRIKRADDEFVYGFGAEPVLTESSLFRKNRPISFTLKITDKDMLAALEPEEQQEIADLLLEYLDIYRRGQKERLRDITASSSLAVINLNTDTEFRWVGKLSDDIISYMDETEESRTVYCETELHCEEDGQEKDVLLKTGFRCSADGEWVLIHAEFSDMSEETE